ncbi:MAG: hypothetical protein B9S32_03185 [Verrucomicrobia bacterium Tous-C9LFEB]|nr:MAG: hypothetical protein B9S32_03185 [Verrucomicrobia bacterium Tous-C9LFEB]
MNLLFLNQYGPGDPSPTARLLRDLEADLTAQGHHVAVASASTDYRQRPARGWRRWGREFLGLLRILRRATFTSPRPEVVISFSSPPGLVVLGALVAARHGARSIHWALDLYPDLALTLGELSPGPLARSVAHAMRWAYRRTDRVVTLDADMQARLRQKGVESEIIAPWTPIAEPVTVDATPAATPFWLYSGNLGRAHEWETLLEIQQRVEAQHPTLELVIQGGGAAWREAQAWAAQRGLQRCRWRDYSREETLLADLLKARVLVATQRPETRGLLWPSKLALLLQLPRPILWIGPTDSAAARSVAATADSAVFPPGSSEAASAWLLNAVAAEPRHHPENGQLFFQPDQAVPLAAWRKLVSNCNK